MQEITIPRAVPLIDQISLQAGQTVTFRAYAIGHWLNDQAWMNPLTNLDAMLRLKKEFEKPDGTKIQLEDGDLRILAQVIRAPSIPREPPLVYVQLQHFDQLILNLVKAK
jgi:hypothetical protein